MLIYPGVTLLDFVGPLTALGPYGQTHLVAQASLRCPPIQPLPSFPRDPR